MRTLSKILLCAAASTAVAGCSWAAFDDLKDETWVDRAGVPSGVNSNLYGEQVAASARTTADGGKVVVLGRNNASLGQITFDGNGVRAQTDSGDIGKTLSFAAFQEHPALVGDPGSDNVAFAVVTLNGNDPNSNTKFALYNTTSQIVKQTEAPPALKHADPVNGLAFAHLANDPAHLDLVAARTAQVMIVSDVDKADGAGLTFSACTHGFEDSYAVAVANLDTTDPLPEIVAAVGSAARDGDSSILIFPAADVTQYNGTAGAPPGSCFMTLAPTSISKPTVHDLGAQLGIVDEGMGPWVVATSPLSNQLFVFQDPMTTGGAEIAIAAPTGAGAFGASLAIGDLDGDGMPELVVGAPKTTVNGVVNAGAVFIYKYDGSKFGEPIELHDSSPEAEQHFGKSVAVAPFGTGNKAVAVVGADGEVFTYFRTKLYLDVRAGHQ